jgi:hypothetical protein
MVALTNGYQAAFAAAIVFAALGLVVAGLLLGRSHASAAVAEPSAGQAVA